MIGNNNRIPKLAIIEDDLDFSCILKECLEEDGDGEYKRTKALERWRAMLGQRARGDHRPAAEPTLNKT